MSDWRAVGAKEWPVWVRRKLYGEVAIQLCYVSEWSWARPTIMLLAAGNRCGSQVAGRSRKQVTVGQAQATAVELGCCGLGCQVRKEGVEEEGETMTWTWRMR